MWQLTALLSKTLCSSSVSFSFGMETGILFQRQSFSVKRECHLISCYTVLTSRTAVLLMNE
jgi:hypothetical protein